MNLSPPRDLNPRIRILSCEPLPEPKRRMRLQPAAGLVAVGVIAAGGWWLTRPAPAPMEPVAAAPAAAGGEVESALPSGAVSAAHFRTTRYVHARMREAVSADFAGAAEVAQRRLPVGAPASRQYPQVESAPTVQSAPAPAQTATAPQAPAPAPKAQPPVETSVTVIEDAGTAHVPASGPQRPAGPEAPGPAD